MTTRCAHAVLGGCTTLQTECVDIDKRTRNINEQEGIDFTAEQLSAVLKLVDDNEDERVGSKVLIPPPHILREKTFCNGF